MDTSNRLAGLSLDRHRLVRIGVYAWSLVGIAVFLVVALTAIGMVRVVLVPLAVALFPAALLSPLAAWLRDRGWSNGLAAAVVVAGFVVAFVGALGALVWLVARQLGDVAQVAQRAYEDVAAWVSGTFGVTLPSGDEVVQRVEELPSAINVGTAMAVVEVLGGALLAIVALFFYLKDGKRLGRFALQLTPERRRDDAVEIGRRVWSSLGGYFRGQIVVAFVDAVFIGIGLVLLGVPLAVPLALLVFFGGLFPIVGAFAAGALAVLVALAHGGIGLALAVLVLNVVVQQLEGNLLEPLIVGRATRLHPLAILAALTAGGVLFGLVGAFFAVPVLATVVRVASFFLERVPELDVEPDSVDRELADAAEEDRALLLEDA